MVLLLVAQVVIYTIFPFFLATLRKPVRAASFSVYIGILLVLGGFLGSLFWLPLSQSLTISDASLAFGALLMTTLFLVILECNLNAVRRVILLVVAVIFFKLLLFSYLQFALNNSSVIKPAGAQAGIFQFSLSLTLLGGLLIILELMLLLFLFERIKERVSQVNWVSILFVLCFVLVLCIEGILLSVMAFATDPALITALGGGASSKLVVGVAFGLPMLLFLLVYRRHMVNFVATPLPLRDLLYASRGQLVAEISRQRDSLVLNEEQLREYAAQMEALDKISQALAEAGLNVQAVLDVIVRHAAEAIGDSCIISLLSDDVQWLEPVAYHHTRAEVKSLMASLFSRSQISATHPWNASVLSSGQPLLVPIVSQAEIRQSILAQFLPYVEQVGVHSALLIPLRVEGKGIGILTLMRDQAGLPYTVEDQAFMVNLADRAALTYHNAQLFEEINGAHARLQLLSRRVLQVQEAERRHTARELHDEIGQVLTSLKILLDATLRLPAETAESRLVQAQALVNELMERVDELSLNLRPQMLDDLGLLPTLLWHFEHYTDQTGIQVTFKQTDLEGMRFSPEVETTVYRLVQEALTNVARHAGTGEVTVLVNVGQELLTLEIEDGGVGFDPAATRSSTGLAGMYERVTLLEGQLTIESSPGSGTYIQAQLPFTQVADRNEEYDDHRFG